jgi:hypothetical protein
VSHASGRLKGQIQLIDLLEDSLNELPLLSLIIAPLSSLGSVFSFLIPFSLHLLVINKVS